MTKEKQLERSLFAIEGVRNNPARETTLKQVGWLPKETTRGWEQYQETYGLFAEQKEKLRQQRQATDELHAAMNMLNEVYHKHLLLARMAVPYQRNVYRTLELGGKRQTRRSAWLSQIRNFYRNLPLIEAELATFGVTADEVAQAEAMVEAVTAARVRQNEARSAAQQARIDRDRAHQELEAWTRRFIRTARFAFADTPQQLEALGIIAR